MKKIIFLLALPLAIAGCSSITNLTPSHAERNSTGLYRVEAAWNTRERTIRPDSIKPMVMIGFETYEMRPELVVGDRWETFIPVPADQSLVHFRFRFDFMRDAISKPHADSKLSPEFTLNVLDKSRGK